MWALTNLTSNECCKENVTVFITHDCTTTKILIFIKHVAML